MIQALKPFACWNDPKPNKCSKTTGYVAISIAAISGIALMTISLLAAGNVLSLNPQLTLALGVAGASLTALGALFFGAVMAEAGGGLGKAVLIALPLLATLAVILGAVGFNGHIAALQGNTGLFLMGSGIITMTFSCLPYWIMHPYSTE